MPLAIVFLVPAGTIISGVAVASLIFLALLGAIGACAGGATVWRGMVRVVFWGAIAMAVTALIGRLVGTAI